MRTEGKQTGHLAYCSIPPSLKIYYQWNISGLKTFFVCGTDERDRLFAVEVHTGYSFSGPLGMKPGLHLYNGPSTKSPLLAAAGEPSLGSKSALSFNNVSQILLPGLRSSDLVTETMRAHITPDDHAAWQFCIEVGGGEKLRRGAFEWRRVKKAERDDDTHNGGFKLVKLGSSLKKEAVASSSSHSGGIISSAAETSDGLGQEVVAVFSWNKFISSPKHPFDLELTGSGRSDAMGERWVLMVLITALRLWQLHVNGRTKQAVVSVSEKARGKDIVVV
ncbi:hypothetical protein GGR51DRAFT_478377 [Nemania sp. FL0031]|nr:hypothetical protein GGR51DRAFT_478377 [Nemania sp. FL0031]